MNTLFIILVFIFIVSVMYLQTLWVKQRVKQWALRTNHIVTKSSFCFMNIGPFSHFGTSSGQSIFKIEAINEKGLRRTGYIRVGGFFFGLLRKRVEVKRDKSLLDE